MADQISKEDKEKILAWLTQRWVSKTCQICMRNNWTIADHLVAPNVSAGGGLMIGGPTYPYVQVICTNCGNTHFFNYPLIQKATGGGGNG